MPNCKPGDLARVIGTMRCPENMGAIVHVIRKINTGDTWQGSDRLLRYRPLGDSPPWVWLIEGVSRPLIAVNSQGVARVSHFTTKRDAYLEPLRPQGDDVDETLLIAGLPNQPVGVT